VRQQATLTFCKLLSMECKLLSMECKQLSMECKLLSMECKLISMECKLLSMECNCCKCYHQLSSASKDKSSQSDQGYLHRF